MPEAPSGNAGRDGAVTAAAERTDVDQADVEHVDQTDVDVGGLRRPRRQEGTGMRPREGRREGAGPVRAAAGRYRHGAVASALVAALIV